MYEQIVNCGGGCRSIGLSQIDISEMVKDAFEQY